MEIQNKTFLITGGASGLGFATAQMIIENGGNVVIADINPEAGQKSFETLGNRAFFVATDVTSEEAVQQTLTQSLERFGNLHGVVNCAGIGMPERVLGREGIHRLSTFSKIIQINLIGSFNVLRLAADVIQHNQPSQSGERGIIINTASIAAFDGQIGQAAYAASKAGIVGMTLPIAREFARIGIRVMTIAPGIFDTPMVAGLSDEIRASLGEQVPFPSRLGQPKEFAALARHIIENQMLNGEVIRLDGAMRMGPK